MKKQLVISADQYSDAGRKTVNQDFHGLCIPEEPLLDSKGIAIAIADGISSSDVSQVASETAVSGFLEDYYCTSEAWSVKTSAQKVLRATNSWLYSQTRNSPHRFNRDKGYICTFSALIIKSRTAHMFHCGDSRIYRVSGGVLEPLTTDHRHSVSEQGSYLTRALGIHDTLEMDYQSLAVEQGDVFILCTDGVYEYINDQVFLQKLRCHSDLTGLAKALTQCALDAGSEDNITLQVVRVDQLPDLEVGDIYQQLSTLPLPPKLQSRMRFEGYTILREIYISSRSHVFLAEDLETQARVVIKTPSTELKDDRAYLELFLMEDWIARRINNTHVLKAVSAKRKRNYLYVVTEFIDGINLSQWMNDNPKPDLEQVRNIIEQIAKGLQAFHRQEMIHQDLRPNNIMIDRAGTVKIIDFGSTRVAGITEIKPDNGGLAGTLQYSAPEYFLCKPVTAKADIYSLGVIAYQMLSGQLPYGLRVSNARTQAAQRKLRYRSLSIEKSQIPEWLDGAIKKAVTVEPVKRYYEVSEFSYDLRHPNKALLNTARPPLIARNPLVFWQGISFFLLLTLLWQFATEA